MTRPAPRVALGWIVRVVAWLVIAAALLAIVAAVLVPRVAGATPYTILTSSMVPRYPPGTLVVVRPVPVDQIGVGTVITYQLRSGDPTVVTHRVVSVAYGSDGAPRFTTQGDANDAVDAAPVEPVQVKGALWYAVPWIGRVGNVVDGRQRETAIHVVAAGLGLYAVGAFAAAWRGRRVRQAGEEER